MMKKAIFMLAIGLMLCATTTSAVDVSNFDDLVGYTVVAATHAVGEVEGADYDKPIKLDNGMIFEFQTYSYFYEYRPVVAILSKETQYGDKSVTLYKLLIADEDEVFDVTRVK